MTVLQQVQRACTEIGGIKRLTECFGSASDQAVEFQDLVHDVAEMIRDAHPWRALTKLYALTTGDGSTEAFALPSDFDRFDKSQRIWTDRLDAPLYIVNTMDHWTEILTREDDIVSGAWVYFGGEFNIKPAPESTETIRYFYQTKHTVLADDGTTTKAEFSADEDTFRLPERLLKLGLVWRYLAKKGLPFDVQYSIYETALGQEVLKDKPAKEIRLGVNNTIDGVDVAYPFNVT